MKRDAGLFFADILQALKAIGAFIAKMDISQFSADDKTSSAVVKKLEIIGEAAKQVPEDIQAKIKLPWKDMAGMRDRLANSYFGIDFVLVWDVIKKKLPEARKEIEAYLEKK
ncbi:DUF86 domain-containing protein [Candidatus Woesearchaeota archaeon]|nr:DUF86 domain-containing protein [Candidatus Woesearchaeota archaeon]